MSGKPEDTTPTYPEVIKEPQSSSTTTTDDIHHHHHHDQTQPEPSDAAAAAAVDTKKWGTHIMGPPAAPSAHPANQEAASWVAGDHQQVHHQPYVVYSPIDKPKNHPFEPVIEMVNTWSKKTETIARNLWHNLKTAPSVPEAAWGKVTLRAKAMTEGGFESLFKQIFTTDPNEKLKKTFACYLSTSTGPVSGTLYLSTGRVAFCSDRPLSFAAPSGQEAWSYYKIMIPLPNLGTINPVVMEENPAEKYIEIVTADGHEFWFMGFVNYEKATHNLLTTVSDLRAYQTSNNPVFTDQPPVVV